MSDFCSISSPHSTASCCQTAENVELRSEVNFSGGEINEFKKKLIDYLISDEFFDKKKLDAKDFDKKFETLVNIINLNAPVKIISINKKDEEIISIFNEIVDEISNIDLRSKIESLEREVSINLDEKLYTELLLLRNQLKGG